MIAMIEELIAKGNAYAAEGHVLFSVPSDPEYGTLSRRDREQMIAGARVEVAPYKRDPADFVLWKPSEEGMVGWDSPWGRGRPGWHIECSAMIRAHLGETIDIHGGGLDLIFPHHENEIAQSRCAHDGKRLAQFWVHNGFVDMGADKMSKSLGNVVTPEELLKQHKGETLRLALLSAQYRQPLPWTATLIAQSKARLDRWYRFYEKILPREGEGDAKPSAAVVGALEDDLNTPQAIAEIDRIIGGSEAEGPNIALGSEAWAAISAAKLLGLLEHTPDEWFRGEGDAGDIESRITARTEAKKRRDFAEADRIRAELQAEGVLLEDGPSGTTWRRA
jgi:cysteinyl-tRNA synthetase